MKLWQKLRVEEPRILPRAAPWVSPYRLIRMLDQATGID
jgi:hypothetical protein